MTTMQDRTADFDEARWNDERFDGCLSVLDRTGDTRLMWDKGNKDEVDNAKATFERLVKKGKHLAFKAVGKKGEQGEQIKEFDPTAERIILVPQMAGG